MEAGKSRLIASVFLLLGPILVSPLALHGQTLTVGLLSTSPETYEGYTLFGPMGSTTTFLIDNDGRCVHTWASPVMPGQAVYLREDGVLLRTGQVNSSVFQAGGIGGRILEIDWDGALLWDYSYASNEHHQHHDVEWLPNGNVLLIAWESKTASEAITAGRDPSKLSEGQLWPDHIVEVQPTGPSEGMIVWEWHVWDHLVQEYDPAQENYGSVADHPELVDINFPLLGPASRGADWNHMNAVRYRAEFDQILLSVHNFNEIWVIDHSTTTVEAAGHTGGRYGKGGDLLYRWGNPQAYGAGDAQDQQLFAQHDAQWITEGSPGEGDILIYNNGTNRPGGSYSTVDQITPPVDAEGSYSMTPGSAWGPDLPTWTFTADPPEDLYSNSISGAQRLPNGNTLICEGAYGTFWEIASDGTLVWMYVNPVTRSGVLTQGDTIPSGPGGQQNTVFKNRRYGPDYPGLSGRDLPPSGPIERYGLLRNDAVQQLDPLDPALTTLFTGSGWTSLDPALDLYRDSFDSGALDPDPLVLDDDSRPLVFYQVLSPRYDVEVTKSGTDLRIRFF